MRQLQTYIDPISTREILSSLNLAIDETRLLREIETKQNFLVQQRQTLPAERIEFLQKEIIKLEVQLDFTRNRSNQI